MSEGSWRGRRSMYEFSQTAEPEPGDEAVGEWSPEQLERMNALFVACLERAIPTGSESASAAQATIVDPTSRMR